MAFWTSYEGWSGRFINNFLVECLSEWLLIEDFERIRFTVLCRTSNEQSWAAMTLLHSRQVCSNKDVVEMQPRHVQQGHENMAGGEMKKSKFGCSAQKEIGFQPTNPLENFFLLPREDALRWWRVRLVPFTDLPACGKINWELFFTRTTNKRLPFPTVRKMPLPKKRWLQKFYHLPWLWNFEASMFSRLRGLYVVMALVDLTFPTINFWLYSLD